MKRVYLHTLPLRIWHWTSALFVIVLIATGWYLRAHGIADLRPHDPVLAWHRVIGYGAVATTLCWFLYNLLGSRFKRHYGLTGKDLKAVPAQVRFYLVSIFKGERNPFRATPLNKYNPLQKIAYGTVMLVLMPIQAVTGLLFVDLPLVRRPLLAWDAVGCLDAVHVAVAYLLVLYLIVHLYMATLGETFFAHTKAMITGFEEAAGEHAGGADMEKAAIRVIQTGPVPGEESER
jgi:thiosulfate reductase cytochrome b subunit